MSEAVIVSTARTPIGKALSRRLQHDAWRRRSAAMWSSTRSSAPASIRREVEDVMLGCALPERATGGNIARQSAIRAGLPVTVGGHDGEPLLRLGPADHRAGGAAHHRGRSPVHRRRRAGKHQPGAGRRDALPVHERLAAGAQARRLHADDRDRRHRGRALQGQPRGAGRIRAGKPAPHRDGAAGRALRRRDRAAADHQEGRRQEHQGGERRAR